MNKVFLLVWFFGTSLVFAADVNFSLNVKDVVPPANVSNFQATSGDGQISLSWQNPSDSDFAGVKIQRSTSTYPLTKDDGQNIYDGSGTSHLDSGLTNGTRYYFTAFSYDSSSNYSSGAIASAIPSPPSLVKEEAKKEEKAKVPVGILPTPAPTVSKKEKISLEDVSFYIKMEKGFLKILPSEVGAFKVIKNTSLLISIPEEIFKKEVNVITLTLENSSYLFKLNKEKKSYEAIVSAPPTKGQFSLVIGIVYTDKTIDSLSVDLLVDPFGYIYRKYFGQELRISGAKVTLYSFNEETKTWQVWDAEKYSQENPKITEKTGEYAFMVPEGKYYLEVKKAGYKDKKTEEFEVKEQVVNKNIEIEKKINWLWVGGGVLVLAGLSFLIRYKFTRRAV